MYKRQTISSALVACLMLLPGCGSQETVETKHEATSAAPTQQSAPSSEVLLTIDGKAKITLNDFNQYKEQFFKIQPQYQQILQYMPQTEQIRIDQNIFQNMVNEVLFEEWVEKNGIDKRADYQNDYKLILEMAKRNLAFKYYQEEYPVKISDDEIKKFYEDNKDKMPELMESQGGIHAKAVKFESETDAKNFLAKLKEVQGDIEKAAQESAYKVEEFTQVNQMSFNVETPVRQKLLETKNFPSDFQVKAGDKAYYVVRAISKEKPVYVPFDQIKAGLENYLKQQKMGDMLTKSAEDLKKKYNAQENNSYFSQKMIEAEKAEKAKQDERAKNSKEGSVQEEVNSVGHEPESSIKGA